MEQVKIYYREEYTRSYDVRYVAKMSLSSALIILNSFKP